MGDTYQIIRDRAAFEVFIDWLPEPAAHEAYYVTLLARKKYHPSALSDKTALKRVVATTKPLLIRKVEQLALPLGRYRNNKDEAIAQDALALYITINPRSLKLAQQNLLRRLVDVALDANNVQNPAALALSEVQKSRSRTVSVDFDFDIDDDDVMETANQIAEIADAGNVRFLRTRGGMHALVNPQGASETGTRFWHKAISALPGCDVVGDSLIPVPGCVQGGFVPYFFSPDRTR